MHTPRYYRNRLLAIQQAIALMPVERGAKNSPRELLKQGYIDTDYFSSEEAFIEQYGQPQHTVADHQLRFEELASYSTYYAMHPEHIAGKQQVTTSIHFPITIEGGDQEVKTVIQAYLANKRKHSPHHHRIRLTRAKAKAVRVKLELLTY